MELGSEYNLDLSDLYLRTNNFKSYFSAYKNVYYTDSGRSAIRSVSLRLSSGGSILLPEYICDSVINCFSDRDISYYRLTDSYEIDCDDLLSKITSETKVIFIMHYFGKLQPEETLNSIKEIAKKQGCIIIEDATHSLFSAIHTIGHYVIASIRKWAPIPKGGVLIPVEDVLDGDPLDVVPDTDNNRLYGMILKDLFLKNKMDCNAEYRKIFKECEDRLDKDDGVKGISDLAGFILECIDTKEIVSRRKANYQYLREELNRLGIKPILSLTERDCPFVFPIRVPNRDEFRNYLMDNKVYCAVHWPYDGSSKEQRTRAVKDSACMLSLPIDQRYGRVHMDYMIKIISEYRGELSF